MRIAFDIDDTLLDWRGAFYSWMDGIGHHPSVDAITFAESSFKQAWPSIPGGRLRELGALFNATPEFRALRPVAGAIETLSMVRTNHICMAVTAPGVHPNAIAARTSQLDALGFEERILLPYQADKVEALIQLRADVLVDDNVETLLAARMRGIPIIVRDLPANRGVDAPRLIEWSPEAFDVALQEALPGWDEANSRRPFGT